MARISRRTFLITAAAAAGGGLAIQLTRKGTQRPDAFIRIAPDGSVTLIMPKVEMGQGTYTSMAMLLAEELEADLARVKLEHAPPDNDRYAEPLIGEQMTGGSTSVRGAFQPLRRAGATARVMLVAAAARGWGVAEDGCRAERGEIIHAASGRRVSFGAVADQAAKLRAPAHVPLKDPKDLKLIGTHVKRLDAPDKVRGLTSFGIDAQPPGLKYAAIAICPVFGGTLAEVKGAPAGARIVRLRDAVAVIAEDSWGARRALDALEIRWNEGPNARLTTADVVRQMAAAAERRGKVARSVGVASRAMAAASKRIQATYQVPFLAHATMEPVNCTVHAREGGCDVWVGTQVPVLAREAAARALGIAPESVRVRNHYLGGGFGRRLETDFIWRAAAVAKEAGSPVKLTYSREDDIRHDMYRPLYFDKLAAGLDAAGRPIAWTHRIVGPAITGRYFPMKRGNIGRMLRVGRAAVAQQGLLRVAASQFSGVDGDAVEGAAEPPYEFPAMLVDYVNYEPPGIPTAWWRGVGPTHNVFVVESFMDELAAAAGKDPVVFRRALLRGNSRALNVLNVAARESNWGSPLPPHRARGVSLLHAFGSYVAQVAEIEIVEGSVRVHRVSCAVDCGMIVNPDTVKAQMEGGIVFGLSAALMGEITLKDGRVEQSNFHDYPVLRMGGSPRVDVHLVKSGETPGGVGEPGTSGAAPALMNAIYAATGVRIRRPPVGNQLELPRRDSNPRPAG